MFIHLGAQLSISDRDIIAIVSIGTVDKSKLNTEFLDFQKNLGKVRSVDMSKPKSVVITSDTVYLSPVSVSTLRRRHNTGFQDLPLLVSKCADKSV